MRTYAVAVWTTPLTVSLIAFPTRFRLCPGHRSDTFGVRALKTGTKPRLTRSGSLPLAIVAEAKAARVFTPHPIRAAFLVWDAAPQRSVCDDAISRNTSVVVQEGRGERRPI